MTKPNEKITEAARSALEDFIEAAEAEARAAGPEAVAELVYFRARYGLARDFFILRRARGQSQQAVAALAGIDQADISRLESAQGNPTVATLLRLAAAYDAELVLRPREGHAAKRGGRR